MNYKRADFKDLNGLKLLKITGKVGDVEMTFITDKGDEYRLIYHQDCCASCSIEDICGDLDDLIGTRILVAVEACSGKTLRGEYGDSCTWTFYKIATIKGTVTIRWYGSSNGYYSEKATFERLEK